MNKLFKILAASIGGGVLLGVGIRLGETAVVRAPAEPAGGPAPADAAELRDWIAESVAAKLAADRERWVEAADARIDARFEARVASRLARLEEAVGRHSTDMSELRECSLRTERSLQKLLTGLDRFVASGPPAAPVPHSGHPGMNGEVSRHEAREAHRDPLMGLVSV